MKLFGIATTFITALVTIASAITIIEPAISNVYQVGSRNAIKWQGGVGKVSIRLTGEGKDKKIVSNFDATKGSYPFKIPSNPGTYRLDFTFDNGDASRELRVVKGHPPK